MRGLRARATLMRAVAKLMCALSLALWLPAAQADELKLTRAQWKAITAVISQQLAALNAGQAEKAFAFATPAIRQQLGDAATFMTMVRDGYAPLLRARYTEFLPGEVVDGVVVQPLRLIANDNTVLVALYTMERQKNGEWRISGCRIAPSTTQAA